MASVEYIVRAVDEMSATLSKIGRNVDQLRGDLDKLGKTKSTPSVELQDKAFAAKYESIQARLAELSKRTAEAKIDISDKDAVAKMAAFQVKLDSIGRRVESPKIRIDGLARAEAQLLGLDAQLDKMGSKAADATGPAGLGALSLSHGGVIAAVSAGAAALIGPLSTLTFGLAGLGLAAAGSWKEIKKGSGEFAALKADYQSFQRALQPTVMQDFNAALRAARPLLKGIEPVAAQTGKALASLFTDIGDTFRSREWQGFFTFMGSTAQQDVKLLGDTLNNLLKALPPLAEGLNNLGQNLLKDVRAVSALINITAQLENDWTRLQQATDAQSHSHSILGGILSHLGQAWHDVIRAYNPALTDLPGLSDKLQKVSDSGNHAAGGVTGFAHAAVTAGKPVFDLQTAVDGLNTSMQTLVGNLLTLQQDEDSWRQSLQAAKHQLDSNKAGLEGNSKAALANRAAVIQSTQAAINFAEHQLTLGKNIGGASRTIQSQISWLQGLHDKSKFTRDEIEALRKEEQKLDQQRINQKINVEGLGHWSVSQSLAPGAGHRRAAGGLIPGSGNTDSYPALLTPGELVIPAKMVAAGVVDHLRGRLPGFAGGGIVPSYAGNVAGLQPWVSRNDQATIQLIDQAVVKATLAGIKAAQAAMLTGAGGAGAARHASMPYLEGLWDAAGGPPGLAHLMAAIAMAESGGNPAAYNPSGATGLWQILGAVDPRDQPFLRNPAVNAHEAVLKYRTQGLGAWVTYTSGAYRQYYDRGGWLAPGATVAVNNTGQPERVLSPAESRRGAPVVTIENYYAQSPSDVVMLAQQLSFAITAPGLG